MKKQKAYKYRHKKKTVTSAKMKQDPKNSESKEGDVFCL